MKRGERGRVSARMTLHPEFRGLARRNVTSRPKEYAAFHRVQPNVSNESHDSSRLPSFATHATLI